MLLTLLVTGLCVAASGVRHASPAPADVQLARVPNGGIQPEIVRDAAGTIHLLYFSGEPAAGNLFYVRSRDDGRTFSRPVRVNTQDGSAIATGTIRGGQLALAPDGRVHAAWNGSGTALPRGPVDVRSGKPGSAMLYTRSNRAGTAFEPQRRVMQRSVALDGGGAIAADAAGNVYVAWHANDAATGNDGEENRLVYFARSRNGGEHFDEEEAPWRAATGACGCCGLRMLATRKHGLFVLFRTAAAGIHRDMYLLRSTDGARSFSGSRIHEWQIAACPMTSMALVDVGTDVLAAWETDGQVHFGPIEPQKSSVSAIRTPSGDPRPRKHPRLAVDAHGRVLAVWTERTAWARGGHVAWQLFDRDGRTVDVDRREPGLPVWSYAAVVARRDGGFTIFY